MSECRWQNGTAVRMLVDDDSRVVDDVESGERP
jgi:hypothetical protein